MQTLEGFTAWTISTKHSVSKRHNLRTKHDIYARTGAILFAWHSCAGLANLSGSHRSGAHSLSSQPRLVL